MTPQTGRWTAVTRRLALTLFAGAIAAALSGCTEPRWQGRGEPQESQGRTMPGGMMGQSRMRGCGSGMRGCGMRGGHGRGMGGSMQRHRQAMMQGIPGDYARLRNPLPATPTVISAGETLYQANCASCHGSEGAGDGPAAQGLSPPPANLRWTLRRPIASDGYLMWAISEGGAQLGTDMPAFAEALSRPERWRIIRYLRTL